MRIIVRTIYGGDLQTHQIHGLPYTPQTNSTLNEKYEHHADAVIPEGTYPTAKYLAIGNGGHRVVAGGTGGIPYAAPVPHRSTDAALYSQQPFVARKLTQDLSPEQRRNYGHRIVKDIGGVLYALYYLKRLDMEDVEVIRKITQVRAGEETSTPYTPNSSNLSPTPPEVTPDDELPTLEEADYVSVNAFIDVNLTPFDIAELINVAEVLYDGAEFALISECAVVSGVDKMVTAEGVGGAPFDFNEVIGAQCFTFISTYHQIGGVDDSIGFVVDSGTSEPLLTEEVVGGGITPVP